MENTNLPHEKLCVENIIERPETREESTDYSALVLKWLRINALWAQNQLLPSGNGIVKGLGSEEQCGRVRVIIQLIILRCNMSC